MNALSFQTFFYKQNIISLFMTKQNSIVCLNSIYSFFFIPSSIDRYLDWLYNLDIVNSIATKRGVQVPML